MSREYTTIDRTAVVATHPESGITMGVEVSNGAPGGIGEAQQRLLSRLGIGRGEERQSPIGLTVIWERSSGRDLARLTFYLVKVPIR